MKNFFFQKIKSFSKNVAPFEGYDITGFKFNYTTDERLKGRAKCISTACKAKHEPFVCEGGGVKASKDKLRVHIRRYHTTKSTPWTESQNIVENRTNMIKEFWNNRKTDFPRLAQVATYICAINASSSNIERLFSHASAKTRDPTKNRLLMKTVELSLQQKLGPAFIEIINDIMQFIGSR